jgi:hypothetical protein
MLGLLTVCPTVFLILHEMLHEVILGHQKLLQVDRRAQWWRWCIATWDLSTLMSGRSLGDVEDWLLKGSCTHHLS